MGARGLPIRDNLSAHELRRLAHYERDPAAARRMYAIANALEGMTRTEAARLAGMERQALHDAVVRYNAEGAGRSVQSPPATAAGQIDCGTAAGAVAHYPGRSRSQAWVVGVDTAGTLPRYRSAL
jgi:hypothetical protein